jgi:DNA mismatch endonuclease (patch repair protein)
MSNNAISPSPSYKGFVPASKAASRAKRANRKKDTAHEVLLCRALWRMGLRYRKHVSRLPGNPDLVFARARVIVFCDGDFWHGRNWGHLKAQLEQRHNSAYWVAKIGRNRERDRHTSALLEGQGWTVLRLWETDIKNDPSNAAAAISATVNARLGAARRCRIADGPLQ